MAVPGSVVGVGKLITPGGQQGPQGVAGSTAALADITQNGLLRQTPGTTTSFVDGTNNYQTLATAIQPTIWSVRLRSFNAIGNPTFEVDQKNVGTTVANPTYLVDRWFFNKTGTMSFNGGSVVPGTLPMVPGTNFLITHNVLYLSLATQQASLTAGDYAFVSQVIEGPLYRELSQDTTSLSLLVWSTVANLKFSVALRDASSAKSLVKLCTVTNASQWTLISLPNLPTWMAGGTFNYASGTAGYILSVCLAAGATFTAGAADVWTTGNYIAAPGADNFASKTVGSQFLCAMIQHEPGPVCSTLQDKPFSQNLDECARYYTKSYGYGVKAATASVFEGSIGNAIGTGATAMNCGVQFPKRMAKAPTVNIYHPSSGAANSVYIGTSGAALAVTGPTYISDTGFLQIQAASGVVAGGSYAFHYVADSGW